MDTDRSLNILSDGLKYGLFKPFLFVLINLILIFKGEKTVRFNEKVIVSVKDNDIKF